MKLMLKVININKESYTINWKNKSYMQKMLTIKSASAVSNVYSSGSSFNKSVSGVRSHIFCKVKAYTQLQKF